MATHSSVLASEIPWTEEPGGLQSVGCKRIGHTHKKKNWTRLSDSTTRGFLHLGAYGATTEFVGTDLLTQANDFQQFLGEE